MSLFIEDFWKNVVVTYECWHWRGGRFENGVPRFTGHRNSRPSGQHTVLAQRLAFILANGPIANKGILVQSTCGESHCLNPSHLKLGWQYEETPTSPEDRFWQRVKKTGTCWFWTGRLLRAGYGQFDIRKQKVPAHRFSFELANGSVPKGLHVLHRCDNPPCVNPAHLWLGTHQENMADRQRKKRHAYGSRMGAAKLTEESVREIRRKHAADKGKTQCRKVTLKSLAREYGVAKSRIGEIIARKAWKHC